MTTETVKSYMEIKSARDKMSALLEDAKGSKDANKIGAMKVLVQTLTAKASDPTTGVRDGELDKFNRSQGWKDKVKNVGNAIAGGDLTGISSDAISAYVEAIDLMSDTQKVNALSQMTPIINSIITHNNRAEFYPLSPSEVLPQEFLSEAGVAYDSYYRSFERNSEGSDSYNFDWGTETGQPSGGGETNFGDELVSMGRMTQTYGTKIADKAHGGMYDSSTVSAWGGVHAGVDIAVPQDSDFYALVDGEIIEASPNAGGWGGTVVIRDPNGAEHRISHLSALNPNIKKGSKVHRGELIAKTGGAKGTKGAGNSTGAHVDYRVRKNGRYIDPLTYNPHA
jgi:murein DD-endopeptidase MepM/ murein hydrolase activator NlpD